MENKDIFTTKNLFVAAFLQASGKVRLLGLEPLDFKTKIFKFTPADEASMLEAAYFSGEMVSAKALFAEYDNLRDLLFDRKGGGYAG